MLVKLKQNRMVRTIQNFELFDIKGKSFLTKRVDAILEDGSVTETIV